MAVRPLCFLPFLLGEGGDSCWELWAPTASLLLKCKHPPASAHSSFFNGLASDNLFFHVTMGRVAQMELQALGLATSYERVVVQELGDEVSCWRCIHCLPA